MSNPNPWLEGISDAVGCIGGGGGLHLARFWRAKQNVKDADTPS
jgi:hypothetical protein